MDALFLATVSPVGKVLIGLIAFAILAPLAWWGWQRIVALWVRCPACGSEELDEGEPHFDQALHARVYPLTCRACGHHYERSVAIDAGTTQSPV